MTNLWTYLSKFGFLSPELKDAIDTILTDDPRGKMEFYWKPGRVCPHIWFLETGLLRIYEENNGMEATAWIQEGPCLFIAPDSSLDGITPSKKYIQTLENCVARRAAMRDVERLMDEYPAFRALYCRINAHYRSQDEQRETDLLTLDPRQRLRKLLREHPDWPGRVPLQILWEHLGMAKNTFEKHRRQFGI